MKKFLITLAISIAGIGLIMLPVKALNDKVANDALERSVTDTRADFIVVDTNNPADHSGLLGRFEYYATVDKLFYFIVVDNLNTIRWVSEVVDPTAVGVNEFEPEHKAYVEANWNVGLYYPSTGVVPFNYEGDDRAYFTLAGFGMPEAGDQLVYQNLPQNRTYSYVAYYDDCMEHEPLILVSGIKTQNAGFTDANPELAPLDPTKYQTIWKDSFEYFNSAYINPLGTDLEGSNWVSTAGSGLDGLFSAWEWRLFKHDFTLPFNAKEIVGKIYYSADNDAAVYWNGTFLGSTQDIDIFTKVIPDGNPAIFKSIWNEDFTPVTGENTVNFVLRNWAWSSGNPTALVYKIEVSYCEDMDLDDDGVLNDVDNCREVANPDQADYDRDRIGDVCDDSDGDGLFDSEDLCRDLDEYYEVDDSVNEDYYKSLGVNRWMYDGAEWIYGSNTKNQNTPTFLTPTNSLVYTHGCTCYQILEEMKHDGRDNLIGHYKYGCSKSILEEWHLENENVEGDEGFNFMD